MNGQPRGPQPMAEALHWVTRITTVALMALVPILGGRKLDEMRGTGYWGTVGLVVGCLLGAWQLRQLVVELNREQSRFRSQAKDKNDSVPRRGDGGQEPPTRDSPTRPQD